MKYQTEIRIVTWKLDGDKSTEDIKHETIVSVGCTQSNTKREAYKRHERLVNALCYLKDPY